MQQLKKGLKDTEVLHMVKERPSLIEVLFPRSSSLTIDAQVLYHNVKSLFTNRYTDIITNPSM